LPKVVSQTSPAAAITVYAVRHVPFDAEIVKAKFGINLAVTSINLSAKEVIKQDEPIRQA
jgi:hypothetical protein